MLVSLDRTDQTISPVHIPDHFNNTVKEQYLICSLKTICTLIAFKAFPTIDT